MTVRLFDHKSICLVFLFLLSAFVEEALAFSSGENTGCDAHGNYGCREWRVQNGIVDRLDCIDPNQGSMPWATAPIRTDKYIVRSGKGPDRTLDPIVYYPEMQMPIYISVTDYNWKYRGLLIHAVANHGESQISVGSWEISDDQAEYFHTPVSCPRAVLHTHAAPPAGTGNIVFRTLFKKGPANTGDFYYPNEGFGDLTLEEAKSEPFIRWLIASPQESCDMACTKEKLHCASDEMEQASIPSLVFNKTNCKDILFDCSEVSPVRSFDGYCYLHTNKCPDFKRNDISTDVKCASVGLSSSNAIRACACTAFTTSGTYSVSPDSFLVLFGLVFSLLQMPAKKERVFFLLYIVVSANTVYAHNWLLTPGRASTEASTIKPCKARSSSDIHVQLGTNNKEFIIKWATGHDRSTYLSIVHHDHEHLLALSNFTAMVKDYIELAPAEENKALEARFKRYHGTKQLSEDDLEFYEAGGDGLYVRQITPEDPNFLDHPLSRTERLYEYSNEVLQNDFWVSYNSEKYPFLVMAAKYDHFLPQPQDYDVVRLKLPEASELGHYIVNYKWSGYYDCTDVVLHPLEVQDTYGIVKDGYIWKKVEHCEYVKPKQVLTPCTVLNTSVEKLIRAVDERFSNSKYENRRVGITCSKVEHKSTVIFKDMISIPWWVLRLSFSLLEFRKRGNETCDTRELGEIRKIDGTVIESEIPWNKWKKDEISDIKCHESETLSEIETSLRIAVSKCSVSDCSGISWLKDLKTRDDIYSGIHTFRLCKTFSNSVLDSQYISFVKQTKNKNIEVGRPVEVSFQSFNSQARQVMLRDTGEIYGDRGNGFVYGWNCPTSSRRYMQSFLENGVETANSTYVRLFSERCNSGERRRWQLALRNGAYRIITTHSKGDGKLSLRGCYVENVQLEKEKVREEDLFASTGSFLSYDKTLEVLDGNLTIEAEDYCDDTCSAINTIKIYPLNSDLEPAWLPSTTDPWSQLKLKNINAIGIVKLKLPQDCRRWHLYRSNKCVDELLGGFFEANNEGAIVRVSNSSCTGFACTGIVCKKIDKAEKCRANFYIPSCSTLEHCDITVNCNGAIGSYVSVQLPGDERIVNFEIEVNRFQPELPGNSFICYAVEARDKTETEPEFEVSQDPDDPKFYSSCFVREKNVEFLPEIDSNNIVTQRYRFNEQCISCTDLSSARNRSIFELTDWKFADQCFDCSNKLQSTAWEIESEEIVAPYIPILTLAFFIIFIVGVLIWILYRQRKSVKPGKRSPAMTESVNLSRPRTIRNNEITLT